MPRDKDPHEQVKHTADRLIIEVEQFKAQVSTPPQGMNIEHVNMIDMPQSSTPKGGILNNEYYGNGTVKDDDEFFHITCHVEPTLYAKIEQGEFVELDKLLPKLKNAMYGGGEPKTELIFREGKPVIVPHIDKSRLITGVHKWEQAFRVYAAIYSQADPNHSAEIWQYVFVINHAASSYSWSNVADYDYAFRHLMAKNPQRSWSKIYVQMWNMCLTEPVNHSTGFGFRNHQSGGRGAGGHSNSPNFANSSAGPHGSTPQVGKKSSKPNYCWKFNKGKCKYGTNCKFINRCSYCDSLAHGLNNCSSRPVNAAAAATNNGTK